MTKDILFLLAPGFVDNDRREFCPECAEMWGILSYFPELKSALDIRYETLAHPREGLVELLGEGKWKCPTLVLAPGVDVGLDAKTVTANGHQILDNARDIAKYFAHRYGSPFPR